MYMLPNISLRIERWKFNKDYGVYVSTLGNFKDRYKRRLPIKICASGYCRVKTEIPAQQWTLAHRLVMLTWKPIPDAENLTVDHLNHNKRDNSLKNLEWVTREENQKRAAEDYLGDVSREKKIISIFSSKVSFEEYRKAIMGLYVNGNLIPFSADALQERLNKYYDNYPREKVERVINEFLMRKHQKSTKIPFGKKVKVELALEREFIER